MAVTGMSDEFVIAPEFHMAIFAFLFFMTQEAHGIVKESRWL